MEGGRHWEIIQALWLWELRCWRGPAKATEDLPQLILPSPLPTLERSGGLPRSLWVSHEVSGSTPVLTVLGFTSIPIF